MDYMRAKILRFGSAIGVAAGAAPAVFAQADTDGIIGTTDFTALAANVASVFTQAFPIAAVAVGITLGLAALVWMVRLLSAAVRGLRSRS